MDFAESYLKVYMLTHPVMWMIGSSLNTERAAAGIYMYMVTTYMYHACLMFVICHPFLYRRSSIGPWVEGGGGGGLR